MHVGLKSRVSTSLLAALVALVCIAPVHAATIEFSEVALSSGTSLAGTDHYAPLGLHFDGSATYVEDNRLLDAGNDTSGITTGLRNPSMFVLFDDGATEVTFHGIAVNTDFYAIAYDENDVVIDNFHAPAQAGTFPVTHTFSGVGTIAKVEFHDNNNFIAVGQIQFTPFPEPASMLAGAGLLGLLAMRRR